MFVKISNIWMCFKYMYIFFSQQWIYCRFVFVQGLGNTVFEYTKKKSTATKDLQTSYDLPLWQAHHILADTLMMPLCMLLLSVACATLTQQSAMAVRRNWVKLSEKVEYLEGIYGSLTNSGQGITGTRLQRNPALTPAHRWGWNILVWN